MKTKKSRRGLSRAVWMSLAAAGLALPACAMRAGERPVVRDVVVYGSSPAALTAAIETLAETLRREGHVTGR